MRAAMLLVVSVTLASADLAGMSQPALDVRETDAIREAVLRELLHPPQKNVTGQSPFTCLAFGKRGNLEGFDPPPAFMARFREMDWVHERSWCVRERKGDRLALGPVLWKRGGGKDHTVRMWVLSQSFGGSSHVSMMNVVDLGGTWKASHEFSSEELPRAPTPDLAEQERRIAALIRRFAAAWNGRDFAAMAALHEPRPSWPPNARMEGLESHLGEGSRDTRIDVTQVVVTFPENWSHRWVSTEVLLRGTWTRTPGAIAPLQPWKHAGSVLPMRVHVQAMTSLWEPADWVIADISPPWVDTRVYH